MSAKDLLIDVALGASLAVALLNLVDWMLSQKQKQWLSDEALSLWNWLDDQKSIPYLKQLKIRQYEIANNIVGAIDGIAAFLVIILLLALILSPFNNDPLTLDEVIKAITILVAMIGVNMANKKISPVLLVWITKGDSTWVYYFRLTLIVSIVTLCSHFMMKYSKLYFGGDTYVGYTIVMFILMFSQRFGGGFGRRQRY